MTSDFHDLQMERDDDLIKGLCAAARSTRTELREWVQRELNACIYEAGLQEAVAQGVLRDEIEQTVKRLRRINHNDLPQAVRDCDDVADDVSRGGYDNVYEAYDQLQKGCAGLVRIVRELLEIRSFIGEIGSA